MKTTKEVNRLHFFTNLPSYGVVYLQNMYLESTVILSILSKKINFKIQKSNFSVCGIFNFWSMPYLSISQTMKKLVSNMKMFIVFNYENLKLIGLETYC